MRSARTGCTGSARSIGSGRRPRPARLLRTGARRALADRLHRARNAGRQALPRLDEGRLLEPHRRLRPQPSSDRGGPFRSRSFQRLLSMNGLEGSMGRVASAADNAAMESFHSLLQKNVLDQRRVWESREQLHLAIVTWIEHTYNNRRRQRRLGKLTPVEFELAFAAAQAA